jgi:hypothetical protein
MDSGQPAGLAIMSFKEISARYLEPISQWLMILGIIALCQPWSEFLHRYGVTIILVGLVGFSIFSKIKPDRAKETANAAVTHHG